MTREEQLQAIDEKYSGQFEALEETLNTTNFELNTLNAERQQLIDAVNAYYDALDKQAEIEQIIQAGLPNL